MRCPPRITLVALVCGALSLPAQAQTAVEKSWPQSFTLASGDRVSYGIVVGMAGSIVVNVTASGQVAVALYKPDGSQARTTLGAGAIRLEYAATKQDASLGESWRVSLAEASGVHRASSAGVSGSIGVVHPPGDVRKVKVATRRVPVALVTASADPDPSLQSYRAVRDAALSTMRAQRARALQVKVSAAVAAATQSGELPTAPRAAAGAMRGSRSGVATSTSQGASTGTGSTGGGGTAPVGSNQPASTAPPPVVASLDTAGGSPGDQVFVTGSGFNPSTGLEAHFLVGPNKDVVGTVTVYNDKQVTAQVPTLQGVPSYSGKFYLRRGTTNSNLVPFRFDPAMDYAVLPVTSDRQLGGFSVGTEVVEDHYIGHVPEWFTCKDDDEFFLHTVLANGWVVDSAYVRQQNHGAVGSWISGDPGAKGDAYVSVWNRGSNSPRIKVHWWCEEQFFENVAPEIHYWPVVVIRGPKGLPWK